LLRVLILGTFLAIAFIIPFLPFQIILVLAGGLFFCATYSHPDMTFRRIMLACSGLGLTYLGLWSLLAELTGLPEFLTQLLLVLFDFGPWIGFALLGFAALFGVLEIARVWALSRQIDKNQVPRFQILSAQRDNLADGKQDVVLNLEIENGTAQNYRFTDLRLVTSTLWPKHRQFTEGTLRGTAEKAHNLNEINLSEGLRVMSEQTQNFELSCIISYGKYEKKIRALLRPIPFLNTPLRYIGICCKAKDSSNKQSVLEDFQILN